MGIHKMLYIGWGKDGHVGGFYTRSFESKKFHSESSLFLSGLYIVNQPRFRNLFSRVPLKGRKLYLVKILQERTVQNSGIAFCMHICIFVYLHCILHVYIAQACRFNKWIKVTRCEISCIQNIAYKHHLYSSVLFPSYIYNIMCMFIHQRSPMTCLS